MMRRSAFLKLAAACGLVGFTGARASGDPLPAANVRLGDDLLVAGAWNDLAGKSVGIATNQTGVLATLEPIVDAVHRNKSVTLRAIYSPEHGLRGDRPAGAYVPSYVDPATGLPVYSLYGATRHPSAAMLDGVDVILFDIQDVGDRAYTYISTLAYLMIAAKKYGKSVWVLDRPNPMGGRIVEGPVLDPRFASFIGLYPLPIRHGMTVGELAKMYNEHFGIGCDLRVIAMEGYTRDMFWPDTGLAWVQTSPNIPEWDTTLVYPATGLLDSAGINNGTGYSKPFKYAGALGIDGARLAAYLNERPIPGVFFRPVAWTPFSGYWNGRTLTGVELIVSDRHAFRAVRTAVELLVAVRAVAPSALAIASSALDRDWGTDSLRIGLRAGRTVEDIVAPWAAQAAAFERVRRPYLLYA